MVERRAGEVEERPADDHEDRELDPRERRLHRGEGAVADIPPRDRRCEERRREDEPDSRRDESPPPSSAMTDVDGELGRVGSGDELGRRVERQELVTRDPAAAADELLLEERDVRRGAAETDGPEAGEGEEDLGGH